MVADETGSKRSAKGGRERRSGRDRAPVTIDLKAEKVAAKAAEAPAAENNAAAAELTSSGPAKGETPSPGPETGTPKPDAPRRPTSGGGAPSPPVDSWRGHAIAGAAGGIAVFILIVLLQLTGLMPSPGRSTAGQALEQAQGASDTVAALERRVMALEAMTQSLPASVDRLDSVAGTVATLQESDKTLAPLAGEVDALKTTVADLGSKVDAADQSNQQAVDDLRQRVSRLTSAAATGTAVGASSEAVATLSDQISDTETGLTSLGERVDSLEETVAALQASTGTGVDSARAARAVALASLRRAVDAGGGFAGDLSMLSTLGVSGDAVDALRPLANDGAPSVAALQAQFPGVADAILSATAGGGADAGFFQRLFGGAGGLVSIRPAGPIAGDDPPAVVSRMQAAVDKGDLATALKERDGLPEPGQQASADWAAAAAGRIKIDGLVDQIAGSLEPPAGN